MAVDRLRAEEPSAAPDDAAARREVMARLRTSLARSRRSGRRVGLCLIEVSGFRSAAQDTVVAALRARCRPDDLVVTLRPHVVAVLLDPLANLDEAWAVASRLQHTVLVLPSSRMPSASVGVEISAAKDTPAAFLARAEGALARARRRANSVELHAPSRSA